MQVQLWVSPEQRNYEYYNPIAPEDISILPFIIVFVFVILFALLICSTYCIVRCVQAKRSTRNKTIAKQILSNLDMGDAKTFAYKFTTWAPYLINHRNQTLYKELEESMFKYKYKKYTITLSAEEQQQIKSFYAKTSLISSYKDFCACFKTYVAYDYKEKEASL
ncbi:MAG: hypothetical protein ACJAWW_001984 [Sulfurimonas sp.]|jgi:hypothetical protein